MRSSATVAMLLIFALCALVPLAFASPPDPLWVGGLFDGGDTDDVIVAATSAEGAADGPTLARAAPYLALAGAVPAPSSADPVLSSLSVRRGRAPPAS
jgi:hypothetical protein